ncbi:S-adenosyl-L-methionine-dependent methyltransferase [Xylogone sp. PMI_703]|nr:S-adenosyl-L-methionine-dependent methyltransferase [Xylogone sp. PMI_703]
MAVEFALADPAANGFQNASNYDKNRPSYPPEAVEKLLSALKMSGKKNARIIDLACGTGKFTVSLEARPEEYEIVAVEPHKAMRETLEAKNLGARVKVLDGNASSMPIEDGWADACIAAQAFHWFDTEESLREISRVTKPNAPFGMIWNAEDYNAPRIWKCTTQWEQKVKDIVAATEDSHPRFRHLKWKAIFEQQQASSHPLFAPLEEHNIKWTVWLTDDALWQRITTLSHIQVLEEPKFSEVKQEVFDILKGADVERNEKGEIAVHGVTYIVWTSKI